MALKKTLTERLFRTSRASNRSLSGSRVGSSWSQTRVHRGATQATIAPDPGDLGIFRRLFHKRPAATSLEIHAVQIGENLMKRLRALDVIRNRIRLDALAPPPPVAAETAGKEGLTVEDARKLLRVAQMEMVKRRLGEMEKSWISYADFIRVCGEGCSAPEQGVRVAKALDESGSVIVFGNAVLLKPEQVLKAIGGLIPLPAIHPNDPRNKELEAMERQKAAIDEKADNLVRRELWCGLGYLVVQTAAFMRLTFWELSWDVMEPICFYVTSMYFMAGYAFFLRTSKEPSFEGFYQSRFSAKQKKLMKLRNFDVERYNELRKVCHHKSASLMEDFSSVPSFDQVQKTMLNH